MQVIELSGPDDPRLADFTGLTDVAARSRREPAEGLFIAEGAKVIARALAAGYQPRRVLTEPKWLAGLAPLLADADVEVLLAPAELLRSVTGYRVHRGALASMRRVPLRTVASVLAGAHLVVVLVDLVDHTNVGAIFRNAAALGADAVLVTPACADPLYRRAVKVSMGAVLALPWTRTGPDPLADLGGAAPPGAGFTTVALTLAPDATPIGEADLTGPRALLLGTEGDGLPRSLQQRCDLRVRIPMAEGVDSLNVAAASAIALHALR
ncbi:MAG TPA: RNA methyltransferase [Candidatus Nanopelagicales bacterium]